MFRKVLLLSVLCIFFLLQGCESSEISMVKESSLPYDESMPIGKLLESYQYISDPEWDVIETNRGQKVVTFKARYDVASLYPNKYFPKEYIEGIADYLKDTPVYLHVEFAIANNQKRFEVSYIGLEIEGNMLTNRYMAAFENDVRAIYQNNPLERHLPPEGEAYFSKAENHSAIKNLSLEKLKFVDHFHIYSDTKKFNTYGKEFYSNFMIFTIKELEEKNDEIIATINYELTDIETSPTTSDNLNFEQFTEYYKDYKVIDKGEWKFPLTRGTPSDCSKIIFRTPGKAGTNGEFYMVINFDKSHPARVLNIQTLPDEFQTILDNHEKSHQEQLGKMLSSMKEFGVYHIVPKTDANDYEKIILSYSDAIYETRWERTLNKPKKIVVYKHSPAYDYLTNYLNTNLNDFIIKKFKLFIAENGEIVKLEEIVGDTDYKSDPNYILDDPLLLREQVFKGNLPQSNSVNKTEMNWEGSYKYLEADGLLKITKDDNQYLLELNTFNPETANTCEYDGFCTVENGTLLCPDEEADEEINIKITRIDKDTIELLLPYKSQQFYCGMGVYFSGKYKRE